MRETRTLTSKGERSASRVLTAATHVLARDGYGGATLARIAEEAGVEKRSVLYYYGSREALLVRVVQTVAEEVAEHLGETARPHQTPAEIADQLVGALWSGLTSLPEHSRAYFALIGGGAGAPVVEEALHELKVAFVRAITAQLRSVDLGRWRPVDDETGLATLILAFFRGLLLEWTESGDPDAITGGLARFRRALEAEYAPLT